MPGPASPGLAARALLLASLAAPALLAGCAKPPPASDPGALADYRAANDPLEPTNRFFYRADIAIDRYTLKPVAEAYVYVLPLPVRDAVHNMLVNIGEPVNLFNAMLEGKPRRAGDALARFAINSTVGVGGLLDVAKNVGYKQSDSTGALTLAYWGLPSGPYLFLPVLGPSSPRDMGGFGLDIALSPYTWAPRDYGVLTFNTAVYLLGTVDARSRVIKDLEDLNRTALDPYATVRSAWQQQEASSLKVLRDDNRMTPPDWYSR